MESTKEYKMQCTWVQPRKQQDDLGSIPSKPFNIIVTQVYAPTSNAKEAEIDKFYEDPQDLLEPTLKRGVLFIIEDRIVKVRSQKIPGVTGKSGFRVQIEAEQRLTMFCQENTLVIANSLSNNPKMTIHGHNQMVNTEIRLIIFFAAKNGGAL